MLLFFGIWLAGAMLCAAIFACAEDRITISDLALSAFSWLTIGMFIGIAVVCALERYGDKALWSRRK